MNAEEWTPTLEQVGIAAVLWAVALGAFIWWWRR